eukprot:COSAG06_NODE_20755_length_782_cov_3.046852_2_plen_78_part_00
MSLLFAGEITGPETVLLTARCLLKGGREDPRERVRQLLSGMRVYLAAWKRRTSQVRTLDHGTSRNEDITLPSLVGQQ